MSLDFISQWAKFFPDSLFFKTQRDSNYCDFFRTQESFFSVDEKIGKSLHHQKNTWPWNSWTNWGHLLSIFFCCSAKISLCLKKKRVFCSEHRLLILCSIEFFRSKECWPSLVAVSHKVQGLLNIFLKKTKRSCVYSVITKNFTHVS